MTLLLGIVSEILVRTYFESQGKTPYAVRERINFSAPYQPRPEQRS